MLFFLGGTSILVAFLSSTVSYIKLHVTDLDFHPMFFAPMGLHSPQQNFLNQEVGENMNCHETSKLNISGTNIGKHQIANYLPGVTWLKFPSPPVKKESFWSAKSLPGASYFSQSWGLRQDWWSRLWCFFPGRNQHVSPRKINAWKIFMSFWEYGFSVANC